MSSGKYSTGSDNGSLTCAIGPGPRLSSERNTSTQGVSTSSKDSNGESDCNNEKMKPRHRSANGEGECRRQFPTKQTTHTESGSRLMVDSDMMNCIDAQCAPSNNDGHSASEMTPLAPPVAKDTRDLHFSAESSSQHAAVIEAKLVEAEEIPLYEATIVREKDQQAPSQEHFGVELSISRSLKMKMTPKTTRAKYNTHGGRSKTDQYRAQGDLGDSSNAHSERFRRGRTHSRRNQQTRRNVSGMVRSMTTGNASLDGRIHAFMQVGAIHASMRGKDDSFSLEDELDKYLVSETRQEISGMSVGKKSAREQFEERLKRKLAGESGSRAIYERRDEKARYSKLSAKVASGASVLGDGPLRTVTGERGAINSGKDIEIKHGRDERHHRRSSSAGNLLCEKQQLELPGATNEGKDTEMEHKREGRHLRRSSSTGNMLSEKQELDFREKLVKKLAQDSNARAKYQRSYKKLESAQLLNLESPKDSAGDLAGEGKSSSDELFRMVNYQIKPHVVEETSEMKNSTDSIFQSQQRPSIPIDCAARNEQLKGAPSSFRLMGVDRNLEQTTGNKEGESPLTSPSNHLPITSELNHSPSTAVKDSPESDKAVEVEQIWEGIRNRRSSCRCHRRSSSTGNIGHSSERSNSIISWTDLTEAIESVKALSVKEVANGATSTIQQNLSQLGLTQGGGDESAEKGETHSSQRNSQLPLKSRQLSDLTQTTGNDESSQRMNDCNNSITNNAQKAWDEHGSRPMAVRYQCTMTDGEVAADQQCSFPRRLRHRHRRSSSAGEFENSQTRTSFVSWTDLDDVLQSTLSMSLNDAWRRYDDSKLDR
ncbi:hypothetical protein ACHAWF_004939 [Thalassiosira exigua]